ncbi:MAG: hypothetical protein IPM17_17495 [Verrucomicrobia bacterium]|jgi:hypothetical protein|nr:hypothetical protein [Verrucomicrobiota bacterium]
MTPRAPYRFSLRLPPEDQPAIESVVRESGFSINDVLVLAIRKGLSDARAALCGQRGRVSSVDPLPEAVLDRIYSAPDDDAESIRVFQRAQTVAVDG